MLFVLAVKEAIKMHVKSHVLSLPFHKATAQTHFTLSSISETHTPQRKGLRSSALRPKKQEPAKQTGPVVIETWVPEEELDLWEIRAFSERSDGHVRVSSVMSYLQDRLLN